MRLNLIRHAESEYNEKGILQGRKDCNLSQNGISKTEEMAKNFPSNFDVCFVSPLKRTKQTANILVKDKNLIYDERLVERCLGILEGTPVTNEAKFMLSQKIAPKNAETFEELDLRVKEFLKDIKEKYDDKNIFIITHAGVIYSFFRVLGIPQREVKNLEIITLEL